jgi:hypothetical protein
MSLAILKNLFSTSLTREGPELFYSEAELRKDGVWKSEPLERELSHKLSQNRHRRQATRLSSATAAVATASEKSSINLDQERCAEWVADFG